MKNSIFWDISPLSPLKFKRRFGEKSRLDLQDQRVSQARNQHEVGSTESFLPQYLAGDSMTQVRFKPWYLLNETQFSRSVLKHSDFYE
jgi:hypothetical protein